MKKVARLLRTHEKLLLNWFKAKGEISGGAVEGLNNKIRVVTRLAYGFRTFDANILGGPLAKVGGGESARSTRSTRPRCQSFCSIFCLSLPVIMNINNALFNDAL